MNSFDRKCHRCPHVPKHDDCAAIIVVKVDALGDLSSGDRKKNRAASVVTSLMVGPRISSTPLDLQNSINHDSRDGSFPERYSSRSHLASRQRSTCVSRPRSRSPVTHWVRCMRRFGTSGNRPYRSTLRQSTPCKGNWGRTRLHHLERFCCTR